ncbi:MAG: DcaP family trimeric outer membrane transporter [Myxococcota bacterium]
MHSNTVHGLIFGTLIAFAAPAFAQAGNDAAQPVASAGSAQTVNDPAAQPERDQKELAALREELEALRARVRKLSEDKSETSDANGILSRRQPIGRFPDDAFVTSGTFERSIRVPGTSGAIRVGGALQINANYDPDNIGFQQIGTQPTIPLDGDVNDGEQQTAIHARHTRVNFDYRAPTVFGQFRVFSEYDFFGDGDEFTNDYDLRLRHAAAELGPWKLGQFWSGFVDVFSFPETADPGGPLAAPVLRNPGLYYAQGSYTESNWGIGVENPAADLGGSTELIASESVPNVVAFGKLKRGWGYLRLAAIGLQLKSTTDTNFTGGAHLSGRIYTAFTGSAKNNISFATQIGQGFVHYYSSFVGELDGVISDVGTIDPTGLLAGFIGYQHFWSNEWRSTITASFFELDSPDGAAPLSYSGGERFSANLFYNPLPGVTLGLEGIYNTIRTVDESEGEGVRIELLTRFDF